MSTYFTISELSKEFSIPITTLRYYQRSGLLNPVIRDENNYGYYSIDQLAQLELITFLRELGLPIRTIQQIVSENMDHAEIMKILHSHCNSLTDKVQELSYQISKIQATEQLYNTIKSSSWDPEYLKVYTRSFDTRWFLTRNISRQLTGTGDAWHLNIKHYITPILDTVNYAIAIYSMGGISNLHDYQPASGPQYHTVFCEPTSPFIDMNCLKDFTLISKGPGDYLVVRYRQSDSARKEAYKILTEHIQSKHLETEELIYDGIIDCVLPPVGNTPRIYELHIKLL